MRIKGRLLVLIFVLVSIAVSGCSHHTLNTEGYVRPPEGYKFSYRKKVVPLVSAEVIDTSAIYLLQNSNYYRDSDEYKNDDNYIRFYADGRFKLQGIKKGLHIDDVNDIKNGVVGYYQLKGKVVKLQIYTDLNGGSDQLEFGSINDQGDLVILNENPRTDFGLGYSEKGIERKIRKGFRNPKVYKKTKVEGLIYTRPDW